MFIITKPLSAEICTEFLSDAYNKVLWMYSEPGSDGILVMRVRFGSVHMLYASFILLNRLVTQVRFDIGSTNVDHAK